MPKELVHDLQIRVLLLVAVAELNNPSCHPQTPPAKRPRASLPGQAHAQDRGCIHVHPSG